MLLFLESFEYASPEQVAQEFSLDQITAERLGDLVVREARLF
jgi:hypothetical protein